MIPNVILVGNGPTRNRGLSWEKVLEKVSRDESLISKYFDGPKMIVPNTIVTIATSDADDSDRNRKYAAAFSEYKYSDNDTVEKILSLPVDTILTTNYTYEFEYALDNRYPEYSSEKKRRYSICTQSNKKRDYRYRLFSYNQIPVKSKKIWHIHGECRTPSSMVLSHEEYAKLISNIVAYSKDRGKDYAAFDDTFEYKSWVDYMILANLYVIGYGFDFAEFDMWWLLNRRLREKSRIGKIIFYEPYDPNNISKINVLSDCGVECRNLGFSKENRNNDSSAFYSEFYSCAVEDIRKEIEKGNK